MIGRYFVDFPPYGQIPHAYVLSNSLFTSIDPPGAGGATPWGINPSGIIVGSYAVPDEHGMPRIHGFVRIPKGRL
jgi:hypothetical protein